MLIFLQKIVSLNLFRGKYRTLFCFQGGSDMDKSCVSLTDALPGLYLLTQGSELINSWTTGSTSCALGWAKNVIEIGLRSSTTSTQFNYFFSICLVKVLHSMVFNLQARALSNLGQFRDNSDLICRKMRWQALPSSLSLYEENKTFIFVQC